MITAVIEHRNDTLIVDLPRAYTDLQSKLLSIGVRTPPNEIMLFGGDDSDINVQLASSSRVAQHLCLLFSEDNSLADVNSTAYLVQSVDQAIKGEIEDSIYHDRYESAAALIADIQTRLLSLGFERLSLYFPLTGNIDLGDHNPFTVGDSFLADYKYDITELIEKNMCISANSVNDKLTSAVWTAEPIRGVLYGKVNMRLREELTEGETERIKAWIASQNEDACGRIEAHPIDSEDGKLTISLWHGGNDYFVYDRAELDEYIEQQNELKMGGM